jgi:hypothetical protein
MMHAIPRFLLEGGLSMIRAFRCLWYPLVLSSSTAMGQMSYPQPTPYTVTKESMWMEWVIAAVFVVGCLVVAFKPAKRSNLE